MVGNVPTKKQTEYFLLYETDDQMAAYIPARSPIHPSFAQLSLEGFRSFLRGKGYQGEFKQSVYEKLKKRALEKDNFFENHFAIVRGTAFVPLQKAEFQWIDKSPKPFDLVFANEPFAIIKIPAPPKSGMDIFGTQVYPPDTNFNVTLDTPYSVSSDLMVDLQGNVVSKHSGQAILDQEKKELNFKPFYEVTNSRNPVYSNIKFPCDVLVNSDLEGNFDWEINGNLTVNGFWSASKIKVTGNAKVEGGIQTNVGRNVLHAVYILGNLEALFVQSSSLVVDGFIKIERVISNSYIETNGPIYCQGEPGKITGCELILKKSGVFANNVGGDNDVPTTLNFNSIEVSDNSKISSVATGTRIQIKKTKSIIQETTDWPIAKKISK